MSKCPFSGQSASAPQAHAHSHAHPHASEPTTGVFKPTPKVQELVQKVEKFLEDYVYPLEEKYLAHVNSERRWEPVPFMEELKAKARQQGLWNFFIPLESDPQRKYGPGLTNWEYAWLCEVMGRAPWSPEVFNCSAPDTGNMEVLIKYGSEQQKQKWLVPLLEGKIRSCFAMTEPAVASSDATNIQSSIKREKEGYVINGRKWWTSGAMDSRCKVAVFMGRVVNPLQPSTDKYSQQSMILVPMDAPGVKIIRPLTVFGYDDAPHGHAEVVFENVRVPFENMLLGEGRGFEIAQGRLGPGRIHHCMRCIGMAERCFQIMKERVTKRVAFGKPLVYQGTILADIATSRMDIEQARLLTLKAAHVMDTEGNKAARDLIAMIKVVAPNAALKVVDRAIQAHGGAGVCSDFPLAHYWAILRTIRIADGPDEVHRLTVAKFEMAKFAKL
eukprot:TRINITY_DN9320_c0_g2_i1.p1 TRINITY_DN9320_c0_g2~~TRINITY_DN9320_c0_g2_i1.p1  ORF type:complete len:459 (+),score=134.28 TRINITY_DN9320_c0_g2_i1:49-1377(+)